MCVSVLKVKYLRSGSQHQVSQLSSFELSTFVHDYTKDGPLLFLVRSQPIIEAIK